MRKKSMMALAVIGSVCLLMSAGFRPALGAQKPVTITYYDTASQMSFVKDQLKRLGKTHPHIKVEMLPCPGFEVYEEKLLTMFAAGDAPDTYGSNPNGIILDHIRYGEVLDLTPYYEKNKELFAGWYPFQLEWYKIGGRYWAIQSHGVTPYFLWYNQTMFDKAGVEYPTEDWMVDDFAEACVKLTKDLDGDGIIDQFGWCHSWYGFLPMVWAFGGDCVDPETDLTKSTLDSPESIEALEFLQDLQYSKGAIPISIAHKRAPFNTGKTGMTQASASHHHAVADVEWQPAMTLNPKGRAGRRLMGVTRMIAITKYAKHPDEAWTFLTQLFDREAQIYVATVMKDLTSVESINEKYVGTELDVVDFREVALSGLKQPLGHVPLVSGEAKREINVALERIFMRNEPAKKVVKEIVPKINELLKELWEGWELPARIVL